MEDCVDVRPIEGNVKGSNGLDDDISAAREQTVGSATVGQSREPKAISTADTVARLARDAGAELAGDAEPRRSDPLGYQGTSVELDAIGDALRVIWAGGDGQFFVSSDLVAFFGSDPSGHGRRIFEDWVSKCQTPGREGETPRRTPDEEWKRARQVRGSDTVIALQELMQRLRGTARTVGCPVRMWPDRKSMLEPDKPVGTSKANIAVALRHFGVTVFKDEFSLRYRVEGYKHFTELNDAALRSLWFACRALGLDTSKDFFVEAILDIAGSDRRHPVRAYFATLKWDKTERIDRLFVDYAGATESAYHRAVGRKLMIAVVRRITQPGAKLDTVPVLIGPQGAGKSTFLKTLAINPAWFEDNLSLGADSKVVIEQTAGKAIVEISEMRGSGREVEAQKAMITRTHDTARGAYKRAAETVARQFILVGTTNASEFLIDHTGNRRFLPVEIGKIDIERLREDLPQLWAEAVVAEANGESLQLPAAVLGDAQQAQRDREINDPIFDAIAKELKDDGGVVDMDALYAIIGLGHDKRDRREQKHQQAIGRAMARLGWTRERVRIKGSRQYVYRRAGDQNYRFGLGHDGQVAAERMTIVGDAVEVGSNVARVTSGTPGRRRVTAASATDAGAGAKT